MRLPLQTCSHGRHSLLLVAVLISSLAGLQRSGAQYTANFQTNIISGVVSNWPGDYFVGHTNHSDVLIIKDGGVLINWVGAMAGVYTSSNNLAIITGSGSAWTNNGYLVLSGGDISYAAGTGNRLVISNGGTVYSYHGYIGGDKNNNSALVTDPGSLWISLSQFVVGLNSSQNSLVVSNGAWVSDSTGYLGYQGSSSGSAVVTGPGTVWTNGTTLHVGSFGGGNELKILDGARVICATGYVGFNSSENSVWLSDPGSLWTNRDDLVVGNAGLNNRLVVTNGAAVSAVRCFVGAGSGAGSLILNGGSLTTDTFLATNGSKSVVEFAAGSIVANTAVVSNGAVFAIGDGVQAATFQMSSGTNTFGNDLWVRTNSALSGCATVGGNALVDGDWTADCGGVFTVYGALTNNGTLELLNGTTLEVYGPIFNNGTIITTNGVVRSYSTVVNNGAIHGAVLDMHNVWTNVASGKWETGGHWSQGVPTNTLWCIITNAVTKTVQIDSTTAGTFADSLIINGLTLGAPDGATNTLQLANSGDGAPLRVIHQLDVGRGSRLLITNGAVEVGALAGQSLTVNGEVSLSAASLSVTNGPTLLGYNGAARMSSSNSTLLFADVSLGHAAGTSGEMAVSGSNSIWRSKNVFIGYGVGSSNNFVQVTGAGTVWSNRNDLVVGLSGALNQLRIGNGALVFSTNGYIGSNVTASGNSVLLADSGSMWSNRNGLVVGALGDANNLIISNGATLVTSISKPTSSNVLGYASASNRVLLTGTGTVWRVGAALGIGFGGAGNSLLISNGGSVFGSSGVLGWNVAASNNTMLVTGGGSVWSNLSSINIGLSGSGNRLEIRDGGFVIGGRDQSFSAMGQNSNSIGNTALITGTGSVWNSGSLSIGNFGSWNSVTVESNGLFRSLSPAIGNNASSSNNSVSVTSGGVWQSTTIYVGMQGSSNSVLVSDGTVLARNLYIGFGATSGCDNLLQIDGGSVIISNTVTAGGLEVRRGTLVLNGGLLKADRLVMTNACGRFVRNGGTLELGNIVLAANLDADGDGMLNGWEQSYSLDPLNAADANADTDGDGMNNIQESQAGTNPTNAASSLSITTLLLTNGDAQVNWQAVGGKSYIVQTSSAAAGGFNDLAGPVAVPGIGESPTNYLDAGGATNWPARFYRIQLAP